MGEILDWVTLVFILATAGAITLWMAGAIYYDVCNEFKWGGLVAAGWVGGVVLLFAVWQPLWQPFAALTVVLALFLVWWFGQKPSHDRDWDPTVVVMPRAVLEGDVVTIENVRNFDYRSLTDFTPRHETRKYHLANLQGVDVIFFVWGIGYMSHPVLVFDFGPDGRVCMSIEVRFRKEQGYSVVRSLFRQQEIIFLVADERDVILRRTKHSSDQEAYLYRLAVETQELRAVFLDYIGAINDLFKKPRWYHALCTNCTTSFYQLPSTRRRCDWRVIANGRLDRALYKSGRLDRSLPFDELRRTAFLNEIANSAPEEGFGDHIRREIEGADMSDEIVPLLKVHGYFHGVPDSALHEIVEHAQVTEHSAGAVVHEANVLLSSIGFVLRGRLKAVRVDSHGTESLFRMIDRGEQFGMMAGALSEPVPIRVIALEPTTLLRLDYEQAIDLSFRYPELRRLWLTAFAGNLKKHFFGATTRRAPMMLALIHESPTSRRAAERLTARLHELGEKISVFSDSDDWKGPPEVGHRRLLVDGRMLELDEIRQQVAAWQDADRIIFDVHVNLEVDRTGRLMELVDRAVYFVPASAADVAIRRLQERAAPTRGWRNKINIAWLLAEGNPIGPAVPNLGDLVSRDFKISESPPVMPWGRSVAGGMERLVHDLRGVRIGVALGGGAARGMSHLGVLKALEQSGIVVDMIAGTSAGAMTGAIHASGLDPDYSVGLFANDLKPSWIFRHLPAGEHWYLVYKYRRGQFDPMLRRYLHNWRLEQLPIPCKTVTVDLVSSNAVVRERGDAAHAILESINLPVLSVPICRNGQALIDGGLVNNVPADVLVSLGCNFVIAVSVSAKIERQFCEITPDRPTPTVTKPTILRTLLRSFLVQNHCLNALGVQPADIVIEPDVTGFEATQFSRTRELAAVGEAAALAQIPRIRQLLARLDPQLFGKNGDSSDLRTSAAK